MAKFKSVAEYVEYLKKNIQKIKTSENMRKLGTLAADLVRKRTQDGYGVPNSEGQRAKLKPLSPEYIEQREGKQRGAGSSKVSVKSSSSKKSVKVSSSKKSSKPSESLASTTSPKKSNLTRTGQLLESIDVLEISEGSVRVGPQGSRSDGKTNAEVGEFVEAAGRPFNKLSATEVKQIQQEVQGILKDALDK